MAHVDLNALQGKRILVTGHTGFKGAWLAHWLRTRGVSVVALSDQETPSGAYRGLAPWGDVEELTVDVRDAAGVLAAVSGAAPDLVLHLAAQALVRRGYREPARTYDVNVMGTVNVLEAVAASESVRAAVVVTTDKVYANHGAGSRPFVETDELGGKDPYSASKACAELVVQDYRLRTGAAVASARAGNVLGGGDTGEDRLLPDIRSALSAGRQMELRNPGAVRPWQFVLDPLAGYLSLATALLTRPDAPAAVNLGPAPRANETVGDVARLAAAAWGGSAEWTAQPGEHPDEAETLRLDASLAQRELGWAPRVGLTTAVGWTVDWWREEDAGRSLRELADDQIRTFEDEDELP